MQRMAGRLIGMLGVALAMGMGGAETSRGDTVLDFSDVAPGTLSVSNPYVSQGFVLTSTSGGFVFNSPDTGNGVFQAPGSNPFYAGANGLAAFTPATITLAAVGGDAFSLVSIDLARNFLFDPAPTVTFTGTLEGGGTVVQSFTVTTPAAVPAFQTFAFTGFEGITSLSWDQPVFTEGLHQFTNIRIASGVVPEPSSLVLIALTMPAAWVGFRRRGRRAG